MSSEAAQKAYPDVEHVEFFGDGFRDKERQAFDRGAVEALRQAAAEARQAEEFETSHWLYDMADNWVVGQ